MTQPHVNFVLGYFRKIQTSGRGERLRTYFFEKKKKPLIFQIFHFTLGNFRKNKFLLWNFGKIVLHPVEIPHDFFLIISGSSTSFLNVPSNFHIFFLQSSWTFQVLKSPVWVFSRIAYSLLNTMKLFNKSVICVINSCLLFRAQQIAHTVTSVHTTWT